MDSASAFEKLGEFFRTRSVSSQKPDSVVILGETGSGKSSTLNSLANIRDLFKVYHGPDPCNEPINY